MEIKKQRLIEAIEDINNREIFEEVLPVNLTKIKLVKIIEEIAKNLTEADEIHKETGELFIDLNQKLPRPLHTYTRKIKIEEELPKINLNEKSDYEFLPVNWVWFWNEVKWVLIEAPGICLKKCPNISFFYINNKTSFCFYEKIGSSLIYRAISKSLNDSILEFLYHTAKLKSLQGFIYKMMIKNLKRRISTYRRMNEREVFVRTKNEDGHLIWKKEPGKMLRARGKWREFIFYRVKNTENISKMGGFLIIEALTGISLFSGHSQYKIEEDFYTFMAIHDKEKFKDRLNKLITEEGASPFFPGIFQWTSLDEQKKRITEQKRTPLIGKAIKALLMINPEIKPAEAMIKLEKKGFKNLSFSNIETYIYRDRKFMRKVKELTNEKENSTK